MLSPDTIKLTISAAYRDGTYLFGGQDTDETLIADTLFRNSPVINSPHKIIDLRILVPKDKAEQLLNGMRTGLVQLYVENMKSGV